LTLEPMTEKIAEKLTRYYERPKEFWSQRIKETERKLARQRDRAAKATKPETKQMWEKAAERTEKSILRMKRLAEHAKPHTGLAAGEVANRWAAKMSE